MLTRSWVWEIFSRTSDNQFLRTCDSTFFTCSSKPPSKNKKQSHELNKDYIKKLKNRTCCYNFGELDRWIAKCPHPCQDRMKFSNNRKRQSWSDWQQRDARGKSNEALQGPQGYGGDTNRHATQTVHQPSLSGLRGTSSFHCSCNHKWLWCKPCSQAQEHGPCKCTSAQTHEYTQQFEGFYYFFS